ncbi:MAG: TetR/AcrR family transcriptional regulator [Acidimicrobiales bacterium]
MPVPSPERRPGDTRRRIVDSAMQLFARKGYAATTVAEIEGAAGLAAGSGAMYRHFPSKDALVLAAVSEYRDRVRALRLDLTPLQDPAQGADSISDTDSSTSRPDDAAQCARMLQRLVDALVEFLAGEGPVVAVSAEAAALPTQTRSVIGQAWDEAYGMVGDILVAAGMTRAQATPLSVAAIGSLYQYVAHVTAWGREPAGVDVGDYLGSWITTWAGAPARARLLALTQ